MNSRAHAPPSPGQVIRALDTVPVSDRHRDPVGRCLRSKRSSLPAAATMYDFVINISVPFLDKMVARMPPVVSEAVRHAPPRSINLTGSPPPAPRSCSPRAAFHRLAAHEAKRCDFHLAAQLALALPVYSIGMVLAFAFISNYSGLSSSTLALALAHPVLHFTFFSPFTRLAGVFPDRFRYLDLTRCLPRCQAGGQRVASPISCWSQQMPPAWQRDRENDLPAVDRHRLLRLVGTVEVSRSVPLYRQTQPDFLITHGRRHHHAAGVCLNPDDPVIVMPKRLADDVARRRAGAD